jgi:hypothetical protein
MVHMFWSGYSGVANTGSKYGLALAQHNSSILSYSLTGQRCHLLHSLCTIFLFLSWGLWVAWAPSTSSLTQLMCTSVLLFPSENGLFVGVLLERQGRKRIE